MYSSISLIFDTHHSNSFTAEHSVCIHDNVVSYIGQDVDYRDDGHGNRNGQGQIPAKKKLFYCALARFMQS